MLTTDGSLRSVAVLVGRACAIKTGEGRETARRLGREQLELLFLFFSRLRRSCAWLDKTAMLRRLHRWRTAETVVVQGISRTPGVTFLKTTEKISVSKGVSSRAINCNGGGVL